jgi:hypothetical protein
LDDCIAGSYIPFLFGMLFIDRRQLRKSREIFLSNGQHNQKKPNMESVGHFVFIDRYAHTVGDAK